MVKLRQFARVEICLVGGQHSKLAKLNCKLIKFVKDNFIVMEDKGEGGAYKLNILFDEDLENEKKEKSNRCM